VEDETDAVAELADSQERLVLLHDTRIGNEEAAVIGASMMDKRMGRQGEVFVNGERLPAFRSEAGTLERWRVLNASPSRFYRLKLDDHPFYVVATDAGRLDEPREATELLLVPGERVEVLVRPKNAGKYVLRTLPTNRGSMGMATGAISTPELELASFEVTGSAGSANLPEKFAPPADLRSLPQPRTREVVFSMQGQMGGASFLIDGKTFSVDRVDMRISLGTVEDWIVRNTSPMDHPFHLHVWPFQLIESSYAGPVQSVEWKDTINVPANSWVRLRIPFTDTPGKTVFHCHILDHEDLGMMATIEVR
jgi:FtsP/CotA-like multicopper oxidase with cupredoxin domain